MATMTWADVMANPFLKDLPFKIELNKWGRIEMSSASNEHGMAQVDVATELQHMKAGLYLQAGAQEVWTEGLDRERRVIRG